MVRSIFRIDLLCLKVEFPQPVERCCRASVGIFEGDKIHLVNSSSVAASTGIVFVEMTAEVSYEYHKACQNNISNMHIKNISAPLRRCAYIRSVRGRQFWQRVFPRHSFDTRFALSRHTCKPFAFFALRPRKNRSAFKSCVFGTKRSTREPRGSTRCRYWLMASLSSKTGSRPVQQMDSRRSRWSVCPAGALRSLPAWKTGSLLT